VLHLLLYGLLAIVLAGVLFAVAVRFLPAGEQVAPPVRDEPPWDLPADRAMRPDEVDAVRLPVALRGYRFAETDMLLDRLADELRARDAEIARLRGVDSSEQEHDDSATARARPEVSEPDEQLEEELAVAAAIDELPGQDAAPEPWTAAASVESDGAPPEDAEPEPARFRLRRRQS
jgi:hypothetical protein